MIVLPVGMYHCFTLDSDNYIKIIRFQNVRLCQSVRTYIDLCSYCHFEALVSDSFRGSMFCSIEEQNTMIIIIITSSCNVIIHICDWHKLLLFHSMADRWQSSEIIWIVVIQAMVSGRTYVENNAVLPHRFDSWCVVKMRAFDMNIAGRLLSCRCLSWCTAGQTMSSFASRRRQLTVQLK